MRFYSVLTRAAFVAGLAMAGAGTARATALQTWVSASGKDSGTCAVTAPCASFKYAIVQTTAGGTISVLTSGSYGPVNITKSINIIAPPGVQAMIAPTAKTGIPVTTSGISFAGVAVNADSTDIVLLRGLTISLQGNGHSSSNGTGIFVGQSIAALTIDHAIITNAEWGIYIYTQTPTSFVMIRSSTIEGNFYGISSNQGNVFIGQNTVSGNYFGLDGTFNSYGDNDSNGNTNCDICFATITQVAHDQ